MKWVIGNQRGAAWVEKNNLNVEQRSRKAQKCIFKMSNDEIVGLFSHIKV